MQILDEMESGDGYDNTLNEDKEYIPPKEDRESSSYNEDAIETISRKNVSMQSSQECKDETKDRRV